MAEEQERIEPAYRYLTLYLTADQYRPLTELLQSLLERKQRFSFAKVGVKGRDS
jgi:hypothetical protein